MHPSCAQIGSKIGSKIGRQPGSLGGNLRDGIDQPEQRSRTLPRQTAPQDPPGEDSETGPSLLDELMTAQEVADIFRLRVSTVESYARRGLLPSLKVGRHRRFLRSQVEQAVRALAEPQSERAKP